MQSKWFILFIHNFHPSKVFYRSTLSTQKHSKINLPEKTPPCENKLPDRTMNPIRNLNFTHGVSSYQIGLHISFRLFFVFLLLHANDVVRFFSICHHAIVERGRFALHKVSFFVWSLVEKLALLVLKSQSDIRYDSITVEYLQLFHILFCLLNFTLTSCNRPSPEAAALVVQLIFSSTKPFITYSIVQPKDSKGVAGVRFGPGTVTVENKSLFLQSSFS